MSEEKNKTRTRIIIFVLLMITALQCYNFYLNCRIQRMVLKQVEVQHWIIQKINEIETRNE